MASTKISQLTEKTVPAGTEELVVNDSGVSKKIKISNLPDNDTTYSVGDGGLTEINFTSAKDTKLTGIEASANNYTHPTGAGNEHLPSTVSQTEAGYLNGVTSAIQTQIDGKSATTHNHDADYSDINHNHDSTYVNASGGTMTGDISLGDNVKAKFGAGNDLQIYHDGGQSVIRELDASSDLYIKASHLRLTNSTGNASTGRYMVAVDGGEVKLFHNNAQKFVTTSTGIDVTGTVSATTVDLGNWTVTESAGVLYFATSGTNKMKLDASGNLTVTGNVTAYGTV